MGIEVCGVWFPVSGSLFPVRGGWIAAFLILLIALSFSANSYGPSKLIFERSWIIEGEPGTSFELEGLLIVNNSDQRVAIERFSPGMEFLYLEDGVIKVFYNGTLLKSPQTLSVRMETAIDRERRFPPDRSFRLKELPPTSLTMYNKVMQKQAQQLIDFSSFYRTIAALVEWTHSSIQYDVSYWGKNENASTIFKDKKGVCVEYSHLLISLFRSIGLKTRYVSGYVRAYDWQPHAWVQVEIPKYGWMDVDPTFNQVGLLDNTHMVMFYGEDQNDVFDVVRSVGPVQFATREEVIAKYLNSRPQPDVKMLYSFDNQTGAIFISVENLRNGTQFVMYSTSLPDGYEGIQDSILVLAPYERKEFTYYTDSTRFQQGFVYRIPFSAYANDARLEQVEIIAKPLPPTQEPPPPFPCLASILFLFPLIFYTRRGPHG